MQLFRYCLEDHERCNWLHWDTLRLSIKPCVLLK